MGNFNITATQLLMSRLCHDLAGGVSAMSTGAELLSEDGGGSLDAVNLIELSAVQTVARLKFLRTAFGAGGGLNGKIGTMELATLCHDYVKGSRVSLVWNENPLLIDLSHGKLVLGLYLIASECLPRGGTVEVDLRQLDGGLGFGISAEGERAGLSDDMHNAMSPNADPASLTPRTVHGHFTVQLAAQLGVELELPSHEETVGETVDAAGSIGRVQFAAFAPNI